MSGRWASLQPGPELIQGPELEPYVSPGVCLWLGSKVRVTCQSQASLRSQLEVRVSGICGVHEAGVAEGRDWGSPMH